MTRSMFVQRLTRRKIKTWSPLKPTVRTPVVAFRVNTRPHPALATDRAHPKNEKMYDKVSVFERPKHSSDIEFQRYATVGTVEAQNEQSVHPQKIPYDVSRERRGGTRYGRRLSGLLCVRYQKSFPTPHPTHPRTKTQPKPEPEEYL